MRRSLILLAVALLPAVAPAKVDLVTLPERERVQLTIYNSADLTLVRDRRTLTLREGGNRLQFSWADTLIDPTSLELLPRDRAREVDVQDLEFPPRVSGLGIWNVASRLSGPVPMEITYFTSGVTWSAYYLATLAPDESTMALQGYVRVQNQSGEDYQNAETRLVVGRINLLDRIADLARRREPYGRPGEPVPMPETEVRAAAPRLEYAKAKTAMADVAPKEIRKEGLSEYFLYTIEGTEDISHGWGTRLISFAAPEVPVRNLYRYEEERYGPKPVRFLEFANDEEHRLGTEPIPGGLVKVFRRLKGGRLTYVGAQTAKYVPKGEEVQLNLGVSEEVAVTPTLVKFATDNYEWRQPTQGGETITGWDEHHTFRVEVANHRGVPARVEIRRNFSTSSWELTTTGDAGTYEKVDRDTVQYVLELPPHTRREFAYTVVLHMGSRAL